ncbi:MAG: hypothetical protein RO257_03485 [Candidatus Kapabacteria bacterium]|nr:hypothetical protein [Candidatus Kapabacteria bacterium]
MAEIELFEYQTHSEVIDLRKLNLENFCTVFSNGENYLKAKQFVGVAQFGDTRICVYPKLYNSESDKKSHSLKNFLYMMQYAYKIHNIKDYSTSAEHQNFDFLEVLIFIYAKNLMDLLKVNLNRSYIVVEDDSNFLKGSWRLGEQLGRMPHIRHRFLVSYDEFTENNPLNRILKFVTFMLLRISRNSRSQTLLQNILLVYAEVDDISKPGHTYLEQVKFSRINQEFKSIFEFAKMFLLKLVGDYSKTKNTNFSFMFDMNILFEQFIAGFIRRENLLSGTKYNNFEMKDQKSSGKYISEKPNAFMLKPDISFWENGNCKLIIDTKYKLLDDTDDKKYGVSQSDAYQMYAYAMKYDCERVILLYPQHLEGKTAENDFGLGSGKTLEIRTVDICRDLKEDSMKPNEENSFRNELKNILNNKIGVEDGISSI